MSTRQQERRVRSSEFRDNKPSSFLKYLPKCTIRSLILSMNALHSARRRFLKALLGQAAIAPAFIRSLRASWEAEEQHVASPLFTLGVASGDPTHHSVLLWTRLAPDPLNGGGMRRRPVEVTWQVA